MNLESRITTYNTLSTQLSSLSDHTLAELIQSAPTNHSGIGGATSGIVVVDGTRLFFKTINLTDLEMRPENIHSTKNIFELPTYYQYGIRLGTAGFGAWRELTCQMLSTNWVLAGECENFPLMYHWRMLPRIIPAPTPDTSKKMDDYVALWGGSPAIGGRFEAIQNAQTSIVLFMELIPHQIDPWLASKFADGTAQEAIAMIERNLHKIISFMKSQGFLHFDAHFGNILTDGDRIYFADFGLAISTGFELSPAESEFFKQHINYDRYETMAMIVLRMIDNLFPVKNPNMVEKNREAITREYATGKGNRAIAHWAATILTRYAPIAVALWDFWRQLGKDMSTPYPKEALERADEDGKRITAETITYNKRHD